MKSYTFFRLETADAIFSVWAQAKHIGTVIQQTYGKTAEELKVGKATLETNIFEFFCFSDADAEARIQKEVCQGCSMKYTQCRCWKCTGCGDNQTTKKPEPDNGGYYCTECEDAS